MGQVSDAVDKLKAQKASTACNDLVGLLRDLGFDVKRGSSGNHYTLDHPGIHGFTGSNFDGGHDKHVKSVYVQAMRKLIEKYEPEITAYLTVKEIK